MGSLVLAGQLQQLLLTALSDGSTYSALVPWILDSDRKVGAWRSNRPAHQPP
jgi:hypothetical protein